MGDERRDYQPGEQIPGTVYRVVRPIGAGGMGTVYDVEDTTVGKRYVLKTLHPELCDRKDLAKRMQAEARVLAGLSHPNIVEVVTAGATTDDLRLPYYVMEKLNGQNLRMILSKKGSLELSHALHIAIDLLDALDCAHEKRVIHRDVKPDNIFLHRGPNGVTLTKLLDFGIMRLVDSEHSVTAGRFMGTLRYASPEQLQGAPVTLQTDLYAAGLVLYEMIAGRGPFDDERDQNHIAAAHIQKEPPPLLNLGIVVPQALEKLLRSALSKKVEKRPKDAFTFAAQLRNLKRMLQAERPRDSTNDRQTDALVVSQVDTGPANLLPTPTASSDAPARSTDPALAPTRMADTRAATPVAKAGPSAAPPSPASPAPVKSPLTSTEASGRDLAKDTLRGMSSPTLGAFPAEPACGPPSGAVTATSAPSVRRAFVDRSAETRSLVPDGPPGMGPQGTEPIPIDVANAPWAVPPGSTLRMPHAPRDSAETAAAQQLLGAFPREMPGTRSDAASSNTVTPLAGTDGKRRLARALVVVGAFGLVGIGALVLARQVGPTPPPELLTAGAMPSAVVPPPTLSPPLFDEVPSAAVAAPSASGPLALPLSTPPSTPPSTAEAPSTPQVVADVAGPAPSPRSKPIHTAKPPPSQVSSPSSAGSSTSPVHHRLPGSGL